MRVRAFIFSIFVLAFLCGPFAVGLAQHLHIELPDYIEPESAKYLSGGWSEVNVEERLSINDYISGTAQTSIEKELSNLTPAKATAMLWNAKWQSLGISFSASLLNYDCRPTYYGSHVSYSNDLTALSSLPQKTSEDIETQIGEFGEGLAKIAEKYPDKRFCVLVADDSATSTNNMAYLLSTDIFTTQDAASILRQANAGLRNVTIVRTQYTEAQTYYKHFYTTDHHWNGWGAAYAYRDAIQSLSEIENNGIEYSALIQPLDHLPELSGYSWLRENGSYSRLGLMMINEEVNEPELSAGTIKVIEGATPPALSIHGLERMVKAGRYAEYDFYQTWYGSWEDTKTYNPMASLSDQDALIICDSFGTAFKWIVATGFAHVTTLYDLHDSRPYATSLNETLETTSANTIFLVGRAASYKSVLERFPEYFSLNE